MNEKVYLAPGKSPTGKVAVCKINQTTDAHGQTTVLVQALYGEPWSGWMSGNYVSTKYAIFDANNLIQIKKETNVHK